MESIDEFIFSELKEKAGEVSGDFVLDVFDKAMDCLPEDSAKEEFAKAVNKAVDENIRRNLDEKSLKKVWQHGSQAAGVYVAQEYTKDIFTDVLAQLPEGHTKSEVAKIQENINKFGIQWLLSNDVKQAIILAAEQDVKDEVEKYVLNLSKDRAEYSIDYLSSKLKNRGNTKRNKRIKVVSSSLKKNMFVQLEKGLHDIIYTNDSFDHIVQTVAESTARETARDLVGTYGKNYVKKNADEFLKKVRFSGKGSRRRNKELKKVKSTVTEELSAQTVENAIAVISGDKSLKEAARDTTVNTAKNAAKDFAKGQGAELAAEAIQALVKQAEKTITNEGAKKLTINALSKVATKEGLLKAADTVYEIGKLFKDVLDHKISKAEFLERLGKQGTSVIVATSYSSVGAMAGAVIGGPVGAALGAALGEMIGYVAADMFYNVVLSQLKRTDAAHQEYLRVKEMCDASIARMNRERAEFERITGQLFAHRKQVIDRSFERIDCAMKTNDFDELSGGLNQISREFGKELQAKTFDEFDDMMMDDSVSFKL